MFFVKIGTQLPFLAVNNFFLYILKNIDQKNICGSVNFKAKTKE